MDGRLPGVTVWNRGKPRVLVVDDHRQVLDTVCAILTDDFIVAGVATDGRQALDKARELDPELIVLDVNMPGLDGFQTARALERAGSRAPVVFLSVHDEDGYVGEAFRCGGRGYVVKSHVHRDLVCALDQALHGRGFVPSLTSLLSVTHGSGHAMQIHGELEPFLDGVAAFFDLALRRGDATCVVATEPVREGLGARLRTRGWQVGGPSGHKRYRAIDASEALHGIMRNGLPDADRLAGIAAELDEYRREVAEGASSRLTIFGNMVMVLGAEGNTRAAIALEGGWNKVTHGLPFLTLCAYAATGFQDAGPDVWAAARAEHCALSHAPLS